MKKMSLTIFLLTLGLHNFTMLFASENQAGKAAPNAKIDSAKKKKKTSVSSESLSETSKSKSASKIYER